jgi:large repetitive protein
MSNDTDVDGGLMGILSVTQPAHGTVDTSGGGAVLTYKPSPDYCNTPPGTNQDTFTYTLNGGSTATVSMIVNCS